VLITPSTIYCANAGDSRAIAYQNENTVELSRDHKPEDPIELDRITKAGGSVSFGPVNGGLNLSRALGDLEYKKGNLKPEEQMITANPDITKVKNENIDFIIMGCDGIW
jgi:serine/threonine protein phosphatase PrpC